ncbi:MAG: hypothetical protein AAF529_02165 [Pseudomonadota bacterium]
MTLLKRAYRHHLAGRAAFARKETIRIVQCSGVIYVSELEVIEDWGALQSALEHNALVRKEIQVANHEATVLNKVADIIGETFAKAVRTVFFST